MTKKRLYYPLIISVILAAVYIAHMPIILFCVNTLLLPADIKLLDIEHLGWHDRGITVKKLLFLSEHTQKKQQLFGLHWRFPSFTLNRSQLTVSSAQLNLPKQSNRSNNPSALSLQQVLLQITQLPLQQVTIKNLSGELFPTVLSINWRKEARSQQLSISDQKLTVTWLLDFAQAQLVNSQLMVTSNDKGSPQTITKVVITLALKEDKHQIRLTGDIAVNELLTHLRDYILLPDTLVNLEGQLSFEAQGSLADNLKQLDLQLLIAEDSIVMAELAASTKTSETTLVNIQLPGDIAVHMNNVTTLSIEQLLLTAKHKSHSVNADADVSSIVCEWSDKQYWSYCTGNMALTMDANQFDYQAWVFKDNHLQASSKFRINQQQLNLTIGADTIINSSITNLDNNTGIKNLRIKPAKGIDASFSLPLSVDSIETNELHIMLAQLQVGNVTLSTQLQLSDLKYTATSPQLTANLHTDSLNMRLHKQWMPALALQSKLQLTKSTLTTSGQLKTDQQQLLADFTGQYNYIAEQAELTLNSKSIDIAASTPLSQYFSHWPFDWDILRGKLQLTGDFKWQNKQFSGQAKQQLIDVSGYHATTAFVGFNNTAQWQMHSLEHWETITPIDISVDSVDIGIPISNIQTQLGFNSVEQQLHIKQFAAQLLNGSIFANDIPHHLQQTTTIDLTVKALDLQQALSLSGYEVVQGSGLISGTLPVVIANDSITIEKGLLAAEEPGGVIVYKALTPSSNPSLQWVEKALSNYHYTTLQAKVQYGTQGDLDLQIAMQGINPDLNNGQAINVNLNVADNIPMLLRSLQAGRAVTDVVERKLEQSQ